MLMIAVYCVLLAGAVTPLTENKQTNNKTQTKNKPDKTKATKNSPKN